MHSPTGRVVLSMHSIRPVIMFVLLAALLTAADPSTVRIPLTTLGLSPGDAITISGTAGKADPAGVELALDQATPLEWRAGGRMLTCTVVATAGDAAKHAPAWRNDVPTRAGDVHTVVATATSRSFPMTLQRAMLDARQQLAQAVGSDGAHMKNEKRENVVVVTTGDQGSVTCWIRVQATVAALK